MFTGIVRRYKKDFFFFLNANTFLKEIFALKHSLKMSFEIPAKISE